MRYEYIGYEYVEKEIDSTILTSNNRTLNVKLEDRMVFKCSPIYIYKKPPFYKKAWFWLRDLFKKKE
ncbi:hypothetical protein KRX57_00530 [Weeksellaceae bacterium TAE3-ERU29]|nr:hypothetical protein [Weeksellaceae bacterium TAE3-ERU29]